MEPVKLSFADLFPVIIDFYLGGSLLDSGDIYPGVADIGHVFSGYYTGRLPVLNSMYLGGLEYQSVIVFSHIAHDLVDALNPEELQDTELMLIYGLSPGLIMTKEPVESLED